MRDSDSGLVMSMDSGKCEPHIISPQATVCIRISIADLDKEKLLQFSPDVTIADAKASIINVLETSLKDPINYGLYLPPSNGKAGKFLQEERTIKDYPFQNPVGFLELRYKQRIYRCPTLNASKLKKVNSKNNLRHFLDCVKAGEVDKVVKWLTRGLDPNFHCKVTKETPLTVAAQVTGGRHVTRELIMALYNGGAHLDFRTVDGMTALHRAGCRGNYEAIQVLLDLGQSANTRDAKGLTPLYHAVVNDTVALCVERLLYEHAVLGAIDENGLQEIHQACRFGRVQHLEHLISYGADLNSQTGKLGNTPLHICAQLGQEACTRLLLFRGADRSLTNRAGHTPYQLAVLSEKIQLAAIIKGFREEDIVVLRGPPRLNERRRPSNPVVPVGLGQFQRCASMGARLNEVGRTESNGTTTSLPQGYMHQGLSGSLTSSDIARSEAITFRGRTKSVGGPSSDTPPVSIDQLFRPLQKTGSSPLSRSVCNLAGPGSNGPTPPVTVGQEARRAGGVVVNWDTASDTASLRSGGSLRGPGSVSNDSVGNLTLASSNGPIYNPLLDLNIVNMPRMVVLQKGAKGFGFVIRGMRASGMPTEFKASSEVPAMQFFDYIEEKSAAERAGLKAGDFILEINGESVIACSHEDVVERIWKSGEMLALRVVTVDRAKLMQQHADIEDMDMDRVSISTSGTASDLQPQSPVEHHPNSSKAATASVRSRTSRRITTMELDEMQARGVRPTSTVFDYSTDMSNSATSLSTFKPQQQEIPPPLLPTFLNNETDFKAKLKANRQTSSFGAAAGSSAMGAVSLTSNRRQRTQTSSCASPGPVIASDPHPMVVARTNEQCQSTPPVRTAGHSRPPLSNAIFFPMNTVHVSNDSGPVTSNQDMPLPPPEPSTPRRPQFAPPSVPVRLPSPPSPDYHMPPPPSPPLPRAAPVPPPPAAPVPPPPPPPAPPPAPPPPPPPPPPAMAPIIPATTVHRPPALTAPKPTPPVPAPTPKLEFDSHLREAIARRRQKMEQTDNSPTGSERKVSPVTPKSPHSLLFPAHPASTNRERPTPVAARWEHRSPVRPADPVTAQRAPTSGSLLFTSAGLGSMGQPKPPQPSASNSRMNSPKPPSPQRGNSHEVYLV